MYRIYHGCFKKNADGTNRIVANSEDCLVPSSRPFRKHIEDIPDGVRTHSQHKRQKLVTRHKFETYFHKKTRKTLNDGRQLQIQKFVFENYQIVFTLFRSISNCYFWNSEQGKYIDRQQRSKEIFEEKIQ